MEICKCCSDKYGIKNLNEINNCCYQSCADKLGLDNIGDVLKTSCGEECKKCVDMSKLSQGPPHGFCYYRRIQPPVIWEGFNNDYSTKSYNFVVFFIIIVAIIIIFGSCKKKKIFFK